MLINIKKILSFEHLSEAIPEQKKYMAFVFFVLKLLHLFQGLKYVFCRAKASHLWFNLGR